MMAGWRNWVAGQWQTLGILAWAMRPLAWLAQRHVERKQAAYRLGKRQAVHPGVPVVVVGNIYVGGTGKTPVVIAVTRFLQSRGMTPGVVSRGYGAPAGATPRTGHQGLAAEAFGDEPTLINRQTGVPVSVHPSRVAAARALLAAYPDVDVIVSDDGLQHLALARDLEILVEDVRGIGNGLMLPAGPLREPPERRHQVAAIVTNYRFAAPPAHRTDPSCARPLHVTMRTLPGETRQVMSDQVRSLAGWAAMSSSTRFAAVAAIGQPQLFFDLLTQAGIALCATHALADHQSFDASTFAKVDADVILITSKDAVKCHALNDPRLWEVPIEACFDPADFLERIMPFVPRPGQSA